MSRTSSNAFRCCSAYSGHGAIGTPCHRLSSTEFHPPCVTKPPMAGWARISFCGAHVGHTMPLPLVLSRNPSGRSSSRFASVGCSDPSGAPVPDSAAGGGPRRTQRKRWPERSSAAVISTTCAASNQPMLPKQRNTTDAGGCPSSHAMHSCGGSELSLLSLPPSESTGPMGYTGGAARPGTHRPSAMAARGPGSSSSAVFAMMPVASMKRSPRRTNHV
ncbi:Os07g0503200 [Oryza sativa Japonica Group]|uniref:Os07g0503200 protein n=2 Tax=Oryza sativa subsp. japonica TaxID=39947 RepID=A0A0P0X749_ORYSJ|nr:hypothetical protein EE612_039441 [Oryza sativa]KAB8105523.1 hypothetical protein EE612_039441 [Oryza sativa]BAC83987.1 unknown protein [Oryza sativa Japonica Group]BAF21641.1 Os07g0503200 [Oryza sativa Japonica Group]BAT01655.1 Os07g0503200 [Oryza sativa Japonica Group]|eukprot:NP_001059727.1 Os07g0503200 [Oryza sativa Japonica Group]